MGGEGDGSHPGSHFVVPLRGSTHVGLIKFDCHSTKSHIRTFMIIIVLEGLTLQFSRKFVSKSWTKY